MVSSKLRVHILLSIWYVMAAVNDFIYDVIIIVPLCIYSHVMRMMGFLPLDGEQIFIAIALGKSILTECQIQIY